jgi:hypothetical protein
MMKDGCNPMRQATFGNLLGQSLSRSCGNRRERTWFGDSDDRLYRDRLGIAAAKAGAAIWAYGLMPNHVHAAVTPKGRSGAAAQLRRFAPAHHWSQLCT